MLKRLLIAVFVLGLVMAFSGSAIAADVSHGPLNKVMKIDPTNPKLNSLERGGPEQPATRKPSSAMQKLPSGDASSAPSPIPVYFCDIQDYSGGAAYYWTIPDAYGDDLFNNRFTSDAGMNCTLKVASYLMYWPVTVGNPDMRAYLWSDDGWGFPGTKLDSVDIAWADIDAAHTAAGSNLFFVSADFSAAGWTFSDGEQYHLGWTILDNSGAGTDVLAIISDAADGPYAGEEISSENWNGVWGSMLNDWGLDVTFVILAERCCSTIPYTDCYTQSPWQNIAYIWRTPHPTYGDSAWAMRYEVTQPETLVSVDVWIYDAGNGMFGLDDIYVTLYDDDGTGYPGAALNTVTLPAGTYNAYPAPSTAVFGDVVTGPFHIAFSSAAPPGVRWQYAVSSDGTDGIGASSGSGDPGWPGPGTWYSMIDWWGGDYNFLFDANLCKDEFAICFSQNSGYAYYFWRLPDPYGDTHNAQLVKITGEGCRVQEVGWRLYDNGSPGIYQHDAIVEIYNDVGGLPGGAAIASKVITPADYVLYPGRTYVDFGPDNVIVTNNFWVSITSTSPALDSSQGIRTLSDPGDAAGDFESAEMWNGFWEYMCDGWGVPCNLAFDVSTEICCIPFSEHSCSPATDNGWATLQGDYARTGRSELPLSDAWCDLSLQWRYDDPGGDIFYAAPTIYNGKIAMSFDNHVSVFDMAGGLLYTLSGAADTIGQQMRSAPTIQNINGVDMMFFGGGTAASVLAYDFNTGTRLWFRHVTDLGSLGSTRWLTPVIVDVAGTPVLIYGDDASYVHGLNAVTGADVWPPISLTSLSGATTWKSGATDGVNFFCGIYTPAGEGDIYSIDAATGTITWQLSSTGGLQGTAVFGADYTGGDEGFGGVSYGGGTLYANSRLEGDHPVDGLFYRINSGTGALLDGSATISNRAGISDLGFSSAVNPIIDVNRVYVNTFSRWVSGPAGDPLVVFNRSSGAIDFNAAGPEGGTYVAEGLLTCEPDGVDDLFITGDIDGWLLVLNAETGEPIYRRRNNDVIGSWFLGGALGTDPVTGEVHLVWCDSEGRLYDFKKGNDRQRLQFESYSLSVPIDFGPAASLIADLGPFVTNTGCIDLTLGAVTADLTASGVVIPAFVGTVGEDLLQKSSSIANDLTIHSNEKFIPTVRGDESGSDMMVNRGQEYNNPAATAFPGFLNAVNTPYTGQVIAPGEVVNLELDVIQSAILRGPQTFYITVESDDPDLFIDDVTLVPEARVILIGGCLIDTTTLEFGVGASNYQWVTNTNRLGTGDWDPHGFLIDGDASSYYQGSNFYATSTYQISVSSQDWNSGGGEDDAFISSQADPNWCDNDCKPSLSTGVSLGAMWDGSSYAPITGNMVCATYLDSVQNFDDGTGWDWRWYAAPFDSALSMGITCDSRTVGALDVPELANLTLEIMEFTERNGDSVPNWMLASIHDYDVGGDFGGFDGDNSLGWSAGGAEGGAFGQIKIPFGGCDGPGLINVHGLQGDLALWDWSAYWDSAWIHMNTGPGYFDHDMAGGDGELHITLAAHDFGPNETYTVGIANFGVFGLADNSSSAEMIPMAKLVNQWAGFGRGNVDGSDGCGLADILYLAAFVNNGGTGPVPFMHLGDVNCDGAVDMADVLYLMDYYFNCGPCPCGDWVI